MEVIKSYFVFCSMLPQRYVNVLPARSAPSSQLGFLLLYFLLYVPKMQIGVLFFMNSIYSDYSTAACCVLPAGCS